MKVKDPYGLRSNKFNEVIVNNFNHHKKRFRFSFCYHGEFNSLKFISKEQKGTSLKGIFAYIYTKVSFSDN